MDTNLELRDKIWLLHHITIWCRRLTKHLSGASFPLPSLRTKSNYLYIITQESMVVGTLHCCHANRLTLWLDGSAVICPQLSQRHVAGRPWWTHPHTVRVVSSEERERRAVFEQRRQNQHRMPPAVGHLGHSLREWNGTRLKRMQILAASFINT